MSHARATKSLTVLLERRHRISTATTPEAGKPSRAAKRRKAKKAGKVFDVDAILESESNTKSSHLSDNLKFLNRYSTLPTEKEQELKAKLLAAREAKLAANKPKTKLKSDKKKKAAEKGYTLPGLTAGLAAVGDEDSSDSDDE
ncbi:hypothetical protein YB2330_002884 [Saitoella coloradoensis]